MDNKRSVIIVTDGDGTAFHAVKEACDDLHCHPLDASQGNPTPRDSRSLVDEILKAPKDPVVVMVDDRGDADQGPGEKALDVLIQAPELNVLGVVAVAANTHPVKGVEVSESVDQKGHIVDHAVDKDGNPTSSSRLLGDTVDVLQGYKGAVVGLGDPGKMQGHDAVGKGAPATRQALEEILRKAGYR